MNQRNETKSSSSNQRETKSEASHTITKKNPSATFSTRQQQKQQQKPDGAEKQNYETWSSFRIYVSIEQRM